MSKFLNAEIVERAGQSYLLILLRLPRRLGASLSTHSVELDGFKPGRFASLLMYVAAVLCGFYGNGLEAFEPKAFWLAFSVCLWLFAELVANRGALGDWYASLDALGKRLWLARALCAALCLRGLLLIVETLAGVNTIPLLAQSLLWFGVGAGGWLAVNRHFRSRGYDFGAVAHKPDGDLRLDALALKEALPRRAIWIVLAVVSSLLVWQNTSDNQIPPPVMALWIASALFWSLVFAPRGWSVLQWSRERLEAWRAIPELRRRLVLLALLGIFALGASFRLARIDAMPPEMSNSEHRFVLEESFRIAQGDWPIMSIAQQMQEPMHYYLVAAFAKLTGMGFNHTTLKLVSALTSLIAFPIVFWLGIELAGRDRRKLGLALGLMTCALVAASFWHVIVTRYALRVHLTVPFSALTLVFLVRAMRDNRRSDFVLLGLTLGFAWFSYAAARALPIAAAAGIGLALLLRPISWRERLRCLVHSAIAGLLFYVVVMPYFHFAIDVPFYASQQISKFAFGVEPGAPLDVDMGAFVDQLMANFLTQLRVLHFTSVKIPYQTYTYHATLGQYIGALLVCGLAAWAARLVRRPRDPVWWFLPLTILIMMLPATLRVAQAEHHLPSDTHTLGALPSLYVLAALPVLKIACLLKRILPRLLGRPSAALFCIALTLLAYNYSTSLYFNDYADSISSPDWSKRHMGRTMRGLVDTGVPWGNLIILHSRPSFLYFDARDPYIEAGIPRPGHQAASEIHTVMSDMAGWRNRSDEYRLDASADLVFFYADDDEASSRQFASWFPNGYELELRDIDYMTGSYMLYRAPAPGEARLEELIAQNTQP